MKRVLCILANMNAGGAETFLMKIYRQLDRTKYQMDFCINVPSKCFYEDEIISLGGKIYRIPSKSESFQLYKERLFEVVNSNGYKYVLRIASNGASFIDLKIAKKAGASVCAVRSSNSSDGKGLAVKIAHRLGRFLYGKYVDVKIAPSDLAAIYTFGERAYNNGDVKILHNALDLDVYKFEPEERKRIRAEFEIKESEILCGHIGRFSPQKNHDLLIEIFSELCKERSNYKLLLVGNGELEERIRKKCADKGLQDKVIFAGVRSDIPAVLSAMDVFVFPSLYEGMPNTVIEAQATGLPCIISDRITKEVDITGLVRFMDIEGRPMDWAEEIDRRKNESRASTTDAFINKRYDIVSVTDDFVQIIMEYNNDKKAGINL